MLLFQINNYSNWNNKIIQNAHQKNTNGIQLYLKYLQNLIQTVIFTFLQ